MKSFNHSQKTAFLLILSLLLSSCVSNQKEKEDTKDRKNETMVVGYVAGYRDLDFSTIKVENLTHINYAFANIIDGKVAFGTAETTIDDSELNAQDLLTLQSLKKINPDLKILVSVGGWTWSGDFSDVALTRENREAFAASAVAFLKKYNLDGIDLDWEYPGQVGAGNTFRKEDKENFTLLLEEVRKQLNRQSSMDHLNEDNKYLLTIATGGDSLYIKHTDLGKAHQYLDFINIMTYDFHNGLHHLTGHHAPLERSKQPGATALNIIEAVEGHLRQGVPPEKINLGIPFYGRLWTGVPPVNNGLYQEAESTGSIIYYRLLVNDYINKNGYTSYYDEDARVPYLWNPDKQTFISYENTESILKKMRYIRDQGLGGVMFWEYSDDVESQLLNAIQEGLYKEE